MPIYSISQVQQKLARLGFDPGPIDGKAGDRTKRAIEAYQRANGLAVDGDAGPRTKAKLFPPTAAALITSPPPGMSGAGAPGLQPIPAEWMPDAKMARIVFHWTGGGHKATNLDRKHYHLIVENDGQYVRGIPSIALNGTPKRVGYAEHTLNCNTGSIGISAACMLDAIESPFDAGNYPMTLIQFDRLAAAGAQLARRYAIPISAQTTLSHAEVQPNLGIKQKGKWDFTRFSFAPEIVGAKACGDYLRSAILAHFNAG